MNIQEFSDKVSEAIFMNIEEVIKIEEQMDNKNIRHNVELLSGEKFSITISN